MNITSEISENNTAKLRIMSNNVWWCDINNEVWESMGADCSAEHRSHGLYRVYQDISPDMIGLQECSAVMAHSLMSLMADNRTEYAYLWGRDTPIIYRRDKLELIDSEVFIYPEDVPGFDGSFNNARTKSYCIGVFRMKESGRLLIFASTHLWYKSADPNSPKYQPHSEEARTYQLGLLMDRMDAFQARYNCPAVIVGDLNTSYGSATLKAALGRGFLDAHDLSLKQPDDASGIHYCCAKGFNGIMREGGFGASIDHILLRGVGQDAVQCFERYKPEYYYPVSDHFPLWIDLVMD